MGTYPLQGGTQPTLEAGTTFCQLFQRVKVLGIPMGERRCDSPPPTNSKESPGWGYWYYIENPPSRRP